VEKAGEKRSVFGTVPMRTLTRLQQNRRIIQDFTLTTLAAIPTLYGRLAYMASLRDLSSGRYHHDGLAALYPDGAIQEALELCHEQVFERVLETPLARQENDLRACLTGMEAGLGPAVEHWQRMETYRMLLPENPPDYLRDLFCSNLRALLEILQKDYSRSHSVA